MRPDMARLLVDRGSRGGGDQKNGRLPRELEDLPTHQSMRRAHRDRKTFNEYLSPLRRFLRSRVGKHWDAVYAEIRGNARFENTVQQHILQHLWGYVAADTRLIDSHIVVIGPRSAVSWFRGPEPLVGSDFEFYVHPVSKVLLVNRGRFVPRRVERRRHARYARDRATRCRELAPDLQLHKLDGCWFEVRLATWSIPQLASGERPSADVCDALIGINPPAADRRRRYGRDDVYALTKRQLGKRELKRYGIVND